MQCPICKCETHQYVDVTEIAPSLHDILFDINTQWDAGPGVCFACIDALDMRMDPILQGIFEKDSTPKGKKNPFVFTLSEQENLLWYYHDEKIRLWYRGEIRQKVKAIAKHTLYVHWSITNNENVLLDFGESSYE